MRTKQLLFTTLLLVFFVNFSNAFVKDLNSVSLNNVEATLEDTVPHTFSPVQGSEAVGLDECHYTTGNWSIFLKILCRRNICTSTH